MELSKISIMLKDMQLGKVAEKTGLSKPTIADIRDGVNTNPTLSTIRKIEAYFEARADELESCVGETLEGRQ